MIVIAGPLFSFIFGFLLATAASFWNYNDASASVGSITADGPAYRAGLEAGDRILSVNNTTILSFTDVKEAVQQSQGSDLRMMIVRGETNMEMKIAPDAVISNESGCRSTTWVIGVAAAGDRYSPSLVDAMRISSDQIARQVVSIVRVVARPTFLFPCENNRLYLRSPSILDVLSLLSISFAVINCLPFPLMDGLEMVFCLTALARGRPLRHRSRDRLNLFVLSGIWAVGLLVEIFSLVH